MPLSASYAPPLANQSAGVSKSTSPARHLVTGCGPARDAPQACYRGHLWGKAVPCIWRRHALPPLSPHDLLGANKDPVRGAPRRWGKRHGRVVGPGLRCGTSMLTVPRDPVRGKVSTSAKPTRTTVISAGEIIRNNPFLSSCRSRLQLQRGRMGAGTGLTFPSWLAMMTSREQG